VFVSK